MGLFVTIMAGGAGTRFWPASRKLNPKQLLKLTGDRSMIQSTVDRLEGLCGPQNLLVLTNASLVEAVAAQLPELPVDSIIGEPAKRDTAPCIGLAAALIAARDPDATMVVMPADHVIQPVERFQESIQQAVAVVEADPAQIVTFGIRPTYPAEVFGYIERGAKRSGDLQFDTFAVERFREKPDTETARKFLDAGTFYWNSGIFVWKAATILRALADCEPEMFSHIQAIQNAIGSDDYQETLGSEFAAIRGKSIDFAVMERYDQVQVIEAPFQWDDLGNWSAIPRLRGVDQQGNTIEGKHLGIDTANSIIRSDDGHLIVTVGMKDCIVVHTDDATLIASKDHEGEIKKVVDQLKQNQWDEYL